MTSLSFFVLAAICLKQKVFTASKICDAIFFPWYTVFYVLFYQRNQVKDALEVEDGEVMAGLKEEVSSQGFFEILTVVLIVHSLIKLAEVTMTIDRSRQMSLIIRNSFVEMIKLLIFILAINGVFGSINQVLNPGEHTLYGSIKLVFENSFSFDFID